MKRLALALLLCLAATASQAAVVVTAVPWTQTDYTSNTATLTLAATNFLYETIAQATPAALTINLTSAPPTNTEQCVKDRANLFSTNPATVTTTDSSTIDGSASLVMSQDGQEACFIFNGAIGAHGNWAVTHAYFAAASPTPQGRLTLSSNTPVMTNTVTGTSTIYYDCYHGRDIPWFTGTAVSIAKITSCELSLTLETSGTGVENTTGVFDVFYSGLQSALCVPTNNSGGGWASDTGGSNTARGSGYSKIDSTTLSFFTNGASISYCYNGTTNECSTACAANTLTYLGTFYTTAAGQTGMSFNAAAASGGSNPVLGLWNAYNRVTVASRVQDSAAAFHVHATLTWEPLDVGASNNTNNRVTWVDGLAQSTPTCLWNVFVTNGTSNEFPLVACNFNSTTAAPIFSSTTQAPVSAIITLSGFLASTTTVGFGVRYAQLMENSGSLTDGSFCTGSGTQCGGTVILEM